ncbi:eukaryotic translation initiation factor 3-like protein [Podospora australis]|uniref:Eukaryotic translation initiation factor 3 subunit D n=1 Tax=Podospora australis TaxID=1536484 RepID=A0AAN7AKP7_9PEZI|nr:eukaryotic translation initiation factor 3-like protein [Podospora australis]
MTSPPPGTSPLLDMINALPEPNGTWGPPITTETLLNGVPYAPFSKSDKLGRMADWTDSKDRDGRGGRQQYNRNFRDQQVYGAGTASLFAAPVAEDEASFSVVSNVRDSTKTRFGRGAVFTRGRGGQRGGRGGAPGPGGRQQFQRAGGRGGAQYGGYDSRGGARGGANARGGRRFGWKDYDKPARNRDASVNIKADWKLLEEIDFNRLGKLNLETDEGEDIDSYGFVNYYDRSYDKAPVKGLERKLTALDRAAYNVTTSLDPVIQELAEKDEATIFATDSILSMLMCAPRSVYSWDIVIVRQGNKVFLDKRDNAALDLVTVNENAADAPLEASEGSKDSINQPIALAEEATYINHNFANQVVLEDKKVDMAHENPFYSPEESVPPASKGYKYRRFDLSTSEETPTYLVVRTEIDAVQKNALSGDDQFVTVHALNEFDSKAQGSGGALDWRTKLVSQRGAVVATEMKNNSCKLARWTVQSILAKADVMKLGFVSRVHPKSNDKHVILGVVGWKPKDFANQMNLQLSNGWGIVRTIADMCLQRADGKYILVKDPNKNILRLYEVPAGSLDDEYEMPEPVPSAETEETMAPSRVSKAKPKPKTPQRKVPFAQQKNKPKPNASILNYFKKTSDETLFIGEGNGAGAIVVDGREDAEEEGEAEEQEVADDDDDTKRFDENQGSVKKRRLSPSGQQESPTISSTKKSSSSADQEKPSTPALMDSTSKREKSKDVSILEDKEENEETSKHAAPTQTRPAPATVKKSNGKKAVNPFLNDSSDDDDDDDNDDNDHKVNGDDKENDEPKTTGRVREQTDSSLLRDNSESSSSGGDRLTNGKRISRTRRNQMQSIKIKEEAEEENALPPLLKQETSGINGFSTTAGLNCEDANGDAEEYGEDFTGEELEAMQYMEREQRRMQVEDDNQEENNCPVCGGSMAGASAQAATAHVNSCLDGNPTPLPQPKLRPQTSEKVHFEVDGAEVAKRFMKAAIPRPGQMNPLSLADADNVNGSSGGGKGSVFAKLMAGHAEDSAWATAAATENASRGKPAYERTCPFYKIMPGFSICVDAFRYGAVEGCKAYFLSHFHSDHYIGLSASWVHGPIYCSKVTGSLVKSQLKTAAKYVVELEFDEMVPVPGIKGVTVTMIPANHCPGSSLFLFERALGGGRMQRILHCGDFRACPAHVEHSQLRPETVDAISGKTKQQKIDVCYLDTTYLNPRYSFPPQNDVIRSCAEVCALLNKDLLADNHTEWDSLLRRREGGGATHSTDAVSKFFAPEKEEPKPPPSPPPPTTGPENAFTALQQQPQSRNRLLVVCGTYSIGKERICVAIAQALRTKIFASPAKIRMCKQLDDPELASLMTSDPREAQVHMQMLMELRADTLTEYLSTHRANGFGKVIAFRPSGWSFKPASSAVHANLAPGAVQTTQILHGPGWKTRFRVKDLVPQRGSTKEAMCFGVPYSEHSSFRELAMFLMALRIERVVPTVNVGSDASRKRMKGWTDRWLAERRKGGLIRVLPAGSGDGDGDGDEDGEEGKDQVKTEEKVKGNMWDGKDGKGGLVDW